MRLIRYALLPFVLILAACADAPYVYVPTPRPSPTPIPNPPVVVVDPVSVDWALAVPLMDKIDAEEVSGSPVSVTRADFNVLGKPYESIDVKVDPKDTITSWHVKREGTVLNLHVHFASPAADARVRSYNVR